MKKVLYVLLVLTLVFGCCFTLVACGNTNKYNKELINNGDFEQSGDTLIGWQRSKSVENSSDGVLDIKTYPSVDDNSNYLQITNGSKVGNFIQVYQEVEVTKNAIYKISAKVRNIALSQGGDDIFTGAGIRIMNCDCIVKQYSEVMGDWINFTVYVKPKTADTLKIALIFGADKAYSVGTVAFDDVSMMRVKASEVPDDADVVRLYKVKEPQYQNSSASATAIIIVFAIFTVMLAVGAYYLYRKLLNNDKPLFNNIIVTAIFVGVATLAVRLTIAGTWFGSGQTSALQEIMRNIVNKSTGVASATYTQYAPFELYYMWLIGKICYNWTNMAAVSVMLRLLPALCEAATAVMIYLFAKKYVNDKQAALFGGLYALLPAAFISSGFGVEAPVLIALLFVTFYALIEKKYILLLMTSLISCLWSDIGIYVLPFIVVYEVYLMIKTKDKKLIATMCAGWFISFWAFILLSAGSTAPMFKAGHIMYIFKQYYLLMFNNQVCVNNAFNLYSLFGLNGGSVNNAAFALNIVFSVILVIYTVSLYFKNFNRAEMTLIAGFFLSVMAVFSLNMNETALVIGLILLLMYIIISGDERLFCVFGLLAFMAFVNISTVMDFSGVIGDTYVYTFFNKGDAGYAIGNILTSIIVLYYGWVVYDITTNGNIKMINPLKK